MKIYFLFFFCSFSSGIFAQEWTPLVYDDEFVLANQKPANLASKGVGWYNVHVTDSENNHYVAYQNYFAPNKNLSIKKYDSDTKKWDFLGDSLLTKNTVSRVELAITPLNVLYAAFKEGENKHLRVIRFINNKWENVDDSSVTNFLIDYTTLKADKKGNIYLSYRAIETNSTIYFKKFDGTSWKHLDSTITNIYFEKPCLEIDKFNVPHIALSDFPRYNVVNDNYIYYYSNKLLKFDSTTLGWDTLPSLVSELDNSLKFKHLKFDSKNNPIILNSVVDYTSSTYTHYATASKLENGSWHSLGSSKWLYAPFQLDFGINSFDELFIIGVTENFSLFLYKYNIVSNFWDRMTENGIGYYQTIFPHISFIEPRPVISFSDQTSVVYELDVNATKWKQVATLAYNSYFGFKDPIMATAISNSNEMYALSYNNKKEMLFYQFLDNNWMQIGDNAGSCTWVYDVEMILDNNQRPLLFYSDYSKGDTANVFVKRFNGKTWETVGDKVSEGNAYWPTGVVDIDNTIYIAFSDEKARPSYAVKIKKYDGSNWVDIGSPNLITGKASAIKLAFNSKKELHVAFRDHAKSFLIDVFKYSKTGWEKVGERLGATPQNLGLSCRHPFGFDIDKNDRPMIFSIHPGYLKTITKTEATSNWTQVGELIYSNFTENAFVKNLRHTSKNEPVISYQIADLEGFMQVKKKSDTSSAWDNIGSHPSLIYSGMPTMSINKTDDIIISYLTEYGSYVKINNVYKTNETLNTENELRISEFDVYPNPSNGSFYIKTNDGIETATLYNSLGHKEVFEKNTIKSQFKGLCILQVQLNSGEFRTKKIIIY